MAKIKIDLITGFLGAGKTTFIKKYAEYLMKEGEKIGILENDFGAVNVDMMLLEDALGEDCGLEMISGGCDRETHRRRFKTKLIAMGMSGYDRVLIEPSGIFDVDEFFDALYDEPLDRWYEAGNVIAIVDARPDGPETEKARYLLASEAACAGCVILSRCEDASETEIQETIARLNEAMEAVSCKRRFQAEVIAKDWNLLTDQDMERIASCGYVAEDYEKQTFDEADGFSSLCFLDIPVTKNSLLSAVERITGDPACGTIFRVKGFFRADGGWMELNATPQKAAVTPIKNGQQVLIVIGEKLDKERIGSCLTEG